ncbi:sensor histidine kinase [Hamadaea tsunoensis]|uniref:sensor histidine kinase n=1 Tax=Hamadaea tsunoensis TaxID=53368 RepID=UPI00041C5E2A|nr:nitrate- and nitrite sensing domain-containing protein [Hamadaea tsunoensis]
MARSSAGPGAARADVPGHARRNLFRSIRIQLMLPVVIATLALWAFGLVETRQAVATSRAAGNSRILAGALTATVRLNHQLEQEVAETSDLLLRNGKGEQLLVAQQARTDAALAAYQSASEAASRVSSTVAAAFDRARNELAGLARIRDNALHPPASLANPDGNSPEVVYDELTQSLVSVAESISIEPVSPELIANARVVAMLAAAEHRGAQERALLRDVFARDRFMTGELARLGQLRGSELDRLAQMRSIADQPVNARYIELVSGTDVDQARIILDAALQADSKPSALDVDPDTWYIAQTNALRRLFLFQMEIITTLENDAARIEASARNQSVLTSALTATAVSVTFTAAVLLVSRTSRRLRSLRHTAQTVTAAELPAAIAAVTAAPSPDTVRAVASASADRADAELAAGRDEIGELAGAVGALHRQAVRLAADQALLRLDVARIFVALSRRGQTLVHRQLQLLDEFERIETDPDTLGRLFQLDHLAARMRRNEENLLVLAGADPGRTFAAPQLLSDIVMAAASEIEEYDRIDASAVTEAWVDAYAVSDLVHLLAELLENAAIFSPPSTRVQVSTHRTIDALTLTIYDHGIGIPAEQLNRINEQLVQPVTLTSELASRMGLLVVARLAQRLQLRVELRSGASTGTAAVVSLPPRLLAPAHIVRQRLADKQQAESRTAAEIPLPSIGTVSTLRTTPVRGRAPVAIAESGLPQRSPGGALAPDLTESGPPARPSLAPGVLDPELARARLSSLASGLAAAQRQVVPPPWP